AVIVPFFTEWGGISLAQMMFVQSWFIVWVFLLEIPTGALADYLGRKRTILLGVAANIAGVIVYTSAPHLVFFLAGEFLWALAIALFSGSQDALLYDSLKAYGREHESKKAGGRLDAVKLWGLMIAAPIGSLIARFVGIRETMLFMAVPLIVAFFVLAPLAEATANPKRQRVSYGAIVRSGLKSFAANKAIRVLAADFVFVRGLVFMVVVVYQAALLELNVPIGYFGIIHAAILGIQAFYASNLAAVDRRLGSKKRHIFVSALVPAVAMILLGMVRWLPATVMFVALVLGIGMPRSRLLLNYIHKHVESGERATVISVVSMLEGMFRAGLYLLVGLLVERSVWYTFVVLGGAVMLVAFLSRVKEEHLMD
ncbi:MAG: MFS transporter, partial [Candidatus Wildermuthbacteria bacterium]|nr:MFS transporter [Candidatus Wildermuthbacteria bacterium]